jgi:hypothetical protein
MDKPDENLTIKKDAEVLYERPQDEDLQREVNDYNRQSREEENIRTNVQRNQLRSPVGRAGNDIFRSSSVTNLIDNKIENPIIRRSSIDGIGGIIGGSRNDNLYKYK